jgi:hypothetical protein
MGTVMLCGPGQTARMVLDGQQRLTTVTLLLSALADVLGELPEDQDEPFDGFSPAKIRQYYLTNPLEKNEKRFKLLLSDTDRATLIIDARYQPPGGLIGAAADAVALHRIARLTGERLLQDIGRGLMAAARASPDPAGEPGAPDSLPGARPSVGDERHAPEHARTATLD